MENVCHLNYVDGFHEIPQRRQQLIKNCNDVEQYFKTVLAANLSTSLPACSSKLEEFSKQDLLLMHLQATERSIQTSEQV